MPYGWIQPTLFLSHKSVDIYYVHEDDDAKGCYLKYVYGNHEKYDVYNNKFIFDIRELANYDKSLIHQKIIEHAIDIGLLTNEVHCIKYVAHYQPLSPLVDIYDNFQCVYIYQDIPSREEANGIILQLLKSE